MAAAHGKRNDERKNATTDEETATREATTRRGESKRETTGGGEYDGYLPAPPENRAKETIYGAPEEKSEILTAIASEQSENAAMA